MALSDFDVINVDIRNAYPVFLEIFSHELNANGGRVLKLKFYEGSLPLSLTGLTITATFVTDGFLVAEDVAVAIGNDDICTLDISNTDDYKLLPGTMLVEFKFLGANDKTYYPPTAMVVKVAKSIMTDAQVTPESYGTVSEILQEVANARGNFANLNARFTADETRLADVETKNEKQFNFVELSGNKFDEATDIDTLYAINFSGGNYLVGNFSDVEQWRFEFSEGLEVRQKVSGTWQSWEWIAKKGIDNEVITARGTYANLNARLTADFANKMNFVDLGAQTATAFDNNMNAGTVYSATIDGVKFWFFVTSNTQIQYRLSMLAPLQYRTYANGAWGTTWTAFAKQSDVDNLRNSTPNITVWDYATSEDNDFVVPETFSGKLGDIVVVTTGTGGGGKIFSLVKVISNYGTTQYLWEENVFSDGLKSALLAKADYATINAIFSTDGKLLDVSRDSTLPSVNTNAVYAYLDKNVTTISKSTLLTYYPNLTTVYVDNDETDVTITGTGELTFVFKGDFNAGQLLFVGISKMINNTNSRLTTLENTVGTLNSTINSQLNLEDNV